VNKKRVYPSTNCPLRTEESFYQQEQAEHHNGTTPVTKIPGFKPVSSFILVYMHLLCLGVMKRILKHYWIGKSDKKKKMVNVALPSRPRRQLSDRLEGLRNDTPSDFARKPRGVDEVPRCKAKEFKFILVYCGPLILEKILPKPLYTFSCSMLAPVFFAGKRKQSCKLCKELIQNVLSSSSQAVWKRFTDSKHA